jgi:hypothetical protein
MSERNVEIDFNIEDFSRQGKKKLASIYSHATGKDVKTRNVEWPRPVVIFEFNLNDIRVEFLDAEG